MGDAEYHLSDPIEDRGTDSFQVPDNFRLNQPFKSQTLGWLSQFIPILKVFLKV